jgi:hypothetical protein
MFERLFDFKEKISSSQVEQLFYNTNTKVSENHLLL